MNNRYFIIDANDPNIELIKTVIVGAFENQRYSIDKQKIVIKLHSGDLNNYEFLSPYQEQTHEQILLTLAGPEWTTPENIQ